MGFIKVIILFLIFGICSIIGFLLSKKYVDRVSDLNELKNALNILETKIKFTRKPIADIFYEISNTISPNVGKIFLKSNEYIKCKETVGQAWSKALQETNTNFKQEDIDILKNLSKMLGKTDVEGQISEIRLTETFLNTQIEKAQTICSNNEKMYRKLGTIIGLAVVILLL